jgi:hypothetical protein
MPRLRGRKKFIITGIFLKINTPQSPDFHRQANLPEFGKEGSAF